MEAMQWKYDCRYILMHLNFDSFGGVNNTLYECTVLEEHRFTCFHWQRTKKATNMQSDKDDYNNAYRMPSTMYCFHCMCNYNTDRAVVAQDVYYSIDHHFSSSFQTRLEPSE